MVATVSVSRVDSGNFLLGACVGHGGGVVGRLDVPGVRHHELEVSVAVDAGADVGVVLEPLLRRDCPVALPSCHSVVVLFKGLQELGQDLIFSPFATLDVRVH